MKQPSNESGRQATNQPTGNGRRSKIYENGGPIEMAASNREVFFFVLKETNMTLDFVRRRVPFNGATGRDEAKAPNVLQIGGRSRFYMVYIGI